MKYHVKVIAGVTQYEKEDMYGHDILDAIYNFVRQYVPKDTIIVTIEAIDVERTVKV